MIFGGLIIYTRKDAAVFLSARSLNSINRQSKVDSNSSYAIKRARFSTFSTLALNARNSSETLLTNCSVSLSKTNTPFYALTKADDF